MTVRWTFIDVESGATATVPINPNTMDTPTFSRTSQYAAGAGTTLAGFDSGPAQPLSWNFGGVILTKNHYDLLLRWTRDYALVRIGDHLGRVFEVVIQKFDPIERRATYTNQWRADYTMTCLLLKEIA